MELNVAQLTTLSLVLFALGMLIGAGVLIGREFSRARAGQRIGRAIENSVAGISSAGTGEAARMARPGAPESTDEDPGTATVNANLPLHWLQSPLGKMLVADEDRRLIEQCGFPPARAQFIFLVTRLGLALLLPLLGYVLMQAGLLPKKTVPVMAFAFILGFMGPKLVMKRIAGKRKERVAHELPLFVDLLRLLQGVGLSLDQSLQIMATDFGHVLRVLGNELHIANQQYSRGRTREHSLHRLATLHDNENLAGLVALLVQVDRHGGAVQEPLRLFSERLREHRRSELKARIGKITVKMTGVMVVTLLPALVIVTAGPGFLAVIRALGSMSK